MRGAASDTAGVRARDAGSLTGAVAAHPVCAEARRAGGGARASLTIAAHAVAVAVAGLSVRAASRHLGAGLGGLAGPLGARATGTGTGCGVAADAVHAVARRTPTREGGRAPGTVAPARDPILPGIVGRHAGHLVDAAEQHQHAALAVEGRAGAATRTGTAGRRPHVPGRGATVELPRLVGAAAVASGIGHHHLAAADRVVHREEVVAHREPVARIAQGPPGRRRVPLPVRARAGPRVVVVVVPVEEEQLAARLVEGEGRVLSSHGHERARRGRAVGPALLGAVPLPDLVAHRIPHRARAAIGTVVPVLVAHPPEEQDLAARRIAHHAVSRERARAPLRPELLPAARLAPLPGVVEVAAVAVVDPAEEDERLALRIERQGGIAAPRRAGGGRDLRPGLAVPRPQVVERQAALELVAPEQVGQLRDGIVGHRLVVAGARHPKRLGAVQEGRGRRVELPNVARAGEAVVAHGRRHHAARSERVVDDGAGHQLEAVAPLDGNQRGIHASRRAVGVAVRQALAPGAALRLPVPEVVQEIAGRDVPAAEQHDALAARVEGHGVGIALAGLGPREGSLRPRSRRRVVLPGVLLGHAARTGDIGLHAAEDHRARAGVVPDHAEVVTGARPGRGQWGPHVGLGIELPDIAEGNRDADAVARVRVAATAAEEEDLPRGSLVHHAVLAARRWPATRTRDVRPHAGRRVELPGVLEVVAAARPAAEEDELVPLGIKDHGGAGPCIGRGAILGAPLPPAGGRVPLPGLVVGLAHPGVVVEDHPAEHDDDLAALVVGGRLQIAPLRRGGGAGLLPDGDLRRWRNAERGSCGFEARRGPGLLAACGEKDQGQDGAVSWFHGGSPSRRARKRETKRL